MRCIQGVLTVKIKYIVFDLDQTLFDHSYGEKKCINQIFRTYFQDRNILFKEFYCTFEEYNKKVWQSFENGVRDVEETLIKRFKMLLNHYEVKVPAKKVSDEYGRLYVEYCVPYTGASSLLKRLKNLKYLLVVCSNGSERIQREKLRHHGFDNYFIYSQYGTKFPICKPHEDFFRLLVSKLNAELSEMLIIGDSLNHDIYPAKRLGIAGLHFDKKYLNGKTILWEKLLESILKLRG